MRLTLHRADAGIRPAPRPSGASQREGSVALRVSMQVVGVALLIAACERSPPAAPTPPGRPTAEPASTAATAPSVPVAPPEAPTQPSVQLPPGPIYVCDVAGVRTPIEYADTVESLCRRHPEMGPCKYERDACRRGGGRVYATANGEEVTVAIEAEYDRKVRRVRFQGDGSAAK